MSRPPAARDGRRDCIRASLLDPTEALAQPVPGDEAAVLMPLRLAEGTATVAFTERRADLARHAGDISFPGGRHDPADSDLQATALRESAEEVGLPAGSVELLGALPPISTYVTSFAVYPFVGVVDDDFAWRPDPGEVASVFEVEVERLVATYRRGELTRGGVTVDTHAYELGDHLVWGATARILTIALERFGRCLGAELPQAARAPLTRRPAGA